MAKYRKIDVALHTDRKFRALKPRGGPDGQKLFMWLLTHPQLTSFGAMCVTLPGLAQELRWSPEGLREPFSDLREKGMLEYDEDAHCLVLPNFLKRNQPDNPNTVKSWQKQWELIPECKLKDRLFQRLKRLAERLGEGFSRAFDQGLGQRFGEPFEGGSPNQEQEQEQEQEQDKETAGPPASAVPAPKKAKKPKKKGTDSGKPKGTSDVHGFFDWWDTTWENLHGKKYVFAGGKEGTIIKRLLKAHKLEALQELALQFFQMRGDFVDEAGYTIGVFASQINKLVSGGKKAVGGLFSDNLGPDMKPVRKGLWAVVEGREVRVNKERAKYFCIGERDWYSLPNGTKVNDGQ